MRGRLARFLFRGAAADQQVATLSGGELFRASLACLLLAEPTPQLLVLDEPTNNLDLASQRQLVSALAGYDGALLVASHDARFLRGRRRGPGARARLSDTPAVHRAMTVRTAPKASPLLEALVVTLHDGRHGFSARIGDVRQVDGAPLLLFADRRDGADGDRRRRAWCAPGTAYEEVRGRTRDAEALVATRCTPRGRRLVVRVSTPGPSGEQRLADVLVLANPRRYGEQGRPVWPAGTRIMASRSPSLVCIGMKCVCGSRRGEEEQAGVQRPRSLLPSTKL